VVRVADVNDHSPQLPSDHIRVNLVENNPPKTVLTTINATDSDLSDNARLTYALRPISRLGAGLLTIDPVTGVVTTNISFDYEVELQIQILT